MRGLAEGGYGINIARNVLLMQELQVRTLLAAIFPDHMLLFATYNSHRQAALELAPLVASSSSSSSSLPSGSSPDVVTPRSGPTDSRVSSSSPIASIASLSLGHTGSSSSSEWGVSSSIAADEVGLPSAVSNTKRHQVRVHPTSKTAFCVHFGSCLMPFNAGMYC